MQRVDALQHKALRRIEYCKNPQERASYDALQRKYNIEELNVRRKRSLLRLMYISSKYSNDIKRVTHDTNLHSTKKVKMKDGFSGLTKLHRSPYYRGLRLWEALPESAQKAENNIIFKKEIKIIIT